MKRFLASLILLGGCVTHTDHTTLSVPSQKADTMSTAQTPPAAPRRASTVALHGETLVDDYHWFREKTSPELLTYLEAENAYADAVMKGTGALQQKLYDEMLSRIKQTDVKVPYRLGDYFYYSRTVEGKQYPIYARKRSSVDAPEEITLDLNELAAGHSYLGLGAYEVSDDGNFLAYSLDVTGFRQYTLHVKDLRTGTVLPDRIEKTLSVAWAANGTHLFYTVEDAAKRPYRMYRHQLGSSAPDTLLYEEKDELYRISADRTRSGRYIILTSGSSTTSEVRFLRADSPESELTLIAPREEDHEYYADHHGDSFYIQTNDKGRNFRLVRAPETQPGRANWVEVIPHDPAVKIDGFDPFANFIVVYERSGGLEQFRILDVRAGTQHHVKFPEAAYDIAPDVNKEYGATAFRYRYESYITPSSIYDYEVSTRQQALLKRTEVLGGYDPQQYVLERINASASDGTKVPITIVYKRGVNPRAVNPLLLYGYGSYGYPVPITFSSNRLSLLDRGMVYAAAHIRGGGEMGQQWHDDGKMMKKMNTFTDFIAAAEHLIGAGYTAKDRLVIEGGSAGGLLTGAVVNMRPDLFRIVISHVPFVDVINTMNDPTLPLTVGEYLEWGNPNVEAEYRYIRQYDPYYNIAAKNYPTMLVKTSLNDSQVMYWEATKYVARLRTMKTDQNPLLLKINMGAGHSGASGRYDRLREIAFDYAFILTQLGLESRN